MKTIRIMSAFAFAVAGLLLVVQPARAGTWTALANPAPGGVQLMLLLPDGTVMGHYGGRTNWYRLTPNSSGSYINGTWTTLDSMSDSRRYFASQVLQNGKVIVAGGEYGTGGATTELYNPLTDSWSTVPISASLLNDFDPGDGSNAAFRDPCSMMLPDGRVIVAPVYPGTAGHTVIYNPVANNWIDGPAHLRSQQEATWVKLPDDSILALDKSDAGSERFIPSLNIWINDGDPPVNLYGRGAEVGPALLLPDGRAFFLGGNTNTAFYTPSGTTNMGSWAAGPLMPNQQACPDAPGAMMINGKVLFTCSPLGITNSFPTPTSYYEYDPVANSFSRQNAPGGGLTVNIPCYQTALLVLPDGNILYSDWSSQLYVYTPTGGSIAAGRPSISSVNWHGNGTLRLAGSRLNGISQGASYGDDLQMDSNYPIIRLTSGGTVRYARSFNWSSTSVDPGSMYTDFELPSAVFEGPGGTYSLVTVANGNPSFGITFYGPMWVDYNYSGFPVEIGSHTFPYNTLAEGVSAVTAGGTIAFKPSSRNEAITITKAMTIISVGGPAVIGQ